MNRKPANALIQHHAFNDSACSFSTPPSGLNSGSLWTNVVPSHFVSAVAVIFRSLLLLVGFAVGMCPAVHAQNTHRAQLVRAQSQYFSAADSPSLSITGDLTIEAWVKDQTPFANSEVRAIITKLELSGSGLYRSYSFKRQKDGNGIKTLVLAISNNGTSDTEQFLSFTFDDLGAWTHYAVVYTAVLGRVDCFVNGVNVGTLTGFSTSIPDSNVPVRIGGSFGGDSENHNGSIDDVRLWAVARTETQIQSSRFTQLTGAETGLRSYWKLNNSLADSTGNGNTLTNVNGVTFQTNDLPFVGLASISGAILGTNLPAGTIRVVAPSTSSEAIGSALLSVPGAYTIASLPSGESYDVTAYVDSNGNQTRDFREWGGDYAANSLLLDSNKTGINIAIVAPVDLDNDGLSDDWEQANGLIVGVNDALLDKDGDGLSNILEFYLETNPSLTGTISDSDNDGLADGVEYSAGMNPLSTDSDADGMPDWWEFTHGLNPLVNDAALDRDGDGLTNAQEFAAVKDPRVPDNADAMTLHSYDRIDRLIATSYSNGAWESWTYDGNGNIRAHKLKTARDADGDALPDAWEFANGLSFAPISGRAGTQGFAGDADGDGWTNYQEYLAGTDPKNVASHPPVGGQVGAAWFNKPNSRIIFPPTTGASLSHVWVKVWDADGNTAQVALQWFDTAVQQWKPATLTRVDGVVFVAGSTVAAPPAGMTHDLLWNAQADLVSFNGIVLLRTIAQDAAGMTTSETVPFTVNTTGTPPNSIIVPAGGSVTTDGGTFDSIVINDGGTLTLGSPPASPAPSLETATSAAAAASVLCAAEVNPADGKAYLTVSYQRRADAAGLIYEIQTTTDLATWTTAGADAAPISTTASGATQTVRVRIHPPIGSRGTPVKFVRLRVRTP